MFTDVDLVSEVNFAKTSTKHASEFDAKNCQTNPIDLQEVAVQAIDKRDFEIQVCPDPDKEVSFVSADSTSLMEFLKTAEPLIIDAIRENLKTAAIFAETQSLLASQESYTATMQYKLKQGNLQPDMEAVKVAWNCGGTLLSVAYGSMDHEDWCEHKSIVAVWSTERRGLDQNNATHLLELEHCATSLAFHPRMPGILAGGTFVGKIHVWNLASNENADKMIAESQQVKFAHKEPISCLTWATTELVKADPRAIHLISGGLDGKVIIWALPNSDHNLKPIKCFCTVAEYLPRSIRGTKLTNLEKEVGVTAVTSFPKDNDTFVIGTEPGAIFQCLFSNKETVAEYMDPDNELEVYSPIALSFAHQKGPINSTASCPLASGLFASCGSDGIIQLYNLLTVEPLLTIELAKCPTLDLQWSPSRPLLLAAAQENGSLAIIDLCRSECGSTLEIKLSDDTTTVTRSVAFNGTKPGIIAVADSSGHVTLFELGDGFITSPLNETIMLEGLQKRVKKN